MQHGNPYGSALEAYGSTATETDQRSLEGKVLLKMATRLEDICKRLEKGEKVSLDDIGDAIEMNRKLWTLFVSEMMDEKNPLPKNIRSNIASLGLFVFKRSSEILTDTTPAKIRPLIDINRNIASGLMKQPVGATEENPPRPAATPPRERAKDSLI